MGEYLYSIKGEWDQRAAAARRATDHRAERDASSTYVNQRSEALVERLKRERFRAVFDYLRRGDRAPVINLVAVVEVSARFGQGMWRAGQRTCKLILDTTLSPCIVAHTHCSPISRPTLSSPGRRVHGHHRP